MRQWVAASIISITFSGAACGPTSSDHDKILRLVDELEYVCEVSNEEFRLCTANPGRIPSRLKKGVSYVHKFRRGSESSGAWQEVRKRVLGAGFKITKDVGDRGEKVVYPYQGGEAFELEILGRTERFRVWVLPGRGLAVPGSAIEPEAIHLIVQPK